MYVDITKESRVTAVEWFHGYGGNALGLKRAIPGLQSIAVCERDAFVVANMVSKMEKGLLDAVPIWTDVTDFPTEPFEGGKLDLFVASWPCQGFSYAGKRLGADDPRHLWPHCRKFIQAVRPRFVWGENVEGHVTLGLSTVLADLEEDGYAASWGIFSASEVGAPHQRKRVFILAYDKCAGLQRGGECGTDTPEDTGWAESAHGGLRQLCGVYRSAWPSRPGASQYGWEPPRTVVGNAEKRGDGQQSPERTGGQMPGGTSERVVGKSPNKGQSVRGCGEVGGQGEHEPELERPDGQQDGIERETLSELGLHSNGSSGEVGAPLTSIPLMGYNILGGDYANQKERAREILQELREQINAQDVQWSLGGFWSFFKEKILQSKLRLDVWPQRICYFIWAIQTGNEVEGKELPEMWFTKNAWDSPQRQEPCEQLKRELDYAMCVLSYEIALERGKEPLERPSEMCDMRKWCEDAWVVSEALVPLTEIWKSTFNEESWANRAYFEAANLGANRTDELRMLGNGVVPATAEKAFRVLYAELMAETELCRKPPSAPLELFTQNLQED